ncbi:DUF2946 domain-containing protein [Prodigiosinella confusarubida]|uniref:DUF2946 domain-containing protein n=2 Tax=Serratia sp. (strain ATCC 39006) TaxID=104623 RepID=A0A2I5T7Y9_SERS3|nr:DUF2946 domain-containing protein [Serratia sp. ATCC 39006]AUH05009.1 DUF2946 domain-containing protein [Serratia sp. ATCC 39006]
MMYSRRLIARLTTYAAMFTILMLSGAPIISRHLQCAGLLTSVQHDKGEHAGHSSMRVSGMANASMEEEAGRSLVHHGIDGEDSACGYCDLLIHVPLLLWLFVPALRFMLSSRREAVSITAPTLYLCLNAAFFHRPRAPPYVSVRCKLSSARKRVASAVGYFSITETVKSCQILRQTHGQFVVRF